MKIIDKMANEMIYYILRAPVDMNCYDFINYMGEFFSTIISDIDDCEKEDMSFIQQTINEELKEGSYLVVVKPERYLALLRELMYDLETDENCKFFNIVETTIESLKELK